MSLPLNIIAVIPARYASTRFPYKLMKPLGNKTVIRHTHDNAIATGLFKEVWVVTDSQLIYDEIASVGGKVMMSKQEHESGSDRIAEAIADMNVDIVVNVQGDEPFIDEKSLALLINAFDDASVQVASIMKPFNDLSLVHNPNYVKVVVDKNNNSLLFSRSPIPFLRDGIALVPFYEHIGVYAFRKHALLKFTQWSPTPLELAEKIECLRYLENGIQLRMVITEHEGVKIDVPEDLEKAERYLEKWNSK